MATNIQQNSQTELKTYLEERLRTQFPSASSQDIVNAAEVAMGRRGYVLHVDQRDQQRGSQQNDQQRNSQQNDQQRNSQQNDQQRNSQQNDQQRNSQQNDQQRNSQQDSARRDNQQGQQQALASVVSVREAAISAAQAISEPTIKMAAVASAWVAFASTNAAHEHSQQKLGRN